MSMVSPQTIELVEQIINSKDGHFVTIDKTVLSGILAEIKTLQGMVGADDQKRIDLVQKMTLTFAITSCCDIIDGLARQDYPDMTAQEILLKTSAIMREKAGTLDRTEGNG